KLEKLNPIQCKIAKILIDSKDNVIYQKDLEKLIGIRRSTISGILRTMEKNEIIKKEDSSEDKRVKKIILTEKAKEKNKERIKIFKEINDEMINGISKEEIKIFYQVIDRIMKNLED